MSFGRGTSGIKRASKDTRNVLIKIDEGSVALTPFGSLSRMAPIRVSGPVKSWTAKLRAAFALLFGGFSG
jgi:hypothetical protein